MVYDIKCLIERCFPSPLLLKYPPCFRKCASEADNLSVSMHTSGDFFHMHTSELMLGMGRVAPFGQAMQITWATSFLTHKGMQT